METFFDSQVKGLYDNAYSIINTFLKAKHIEDNSKINIPKEFQEEFFRLVDKVNLNLMDDKDNFFG